MSFPYRVLDVNLRIHEAYVHSERSIVGSEAIHHSLIIPVSSRSRAWSHSGGSRDTIAYHPGLSVVLPRHVDPRPPGSQLDHPNIVRLLGACMTPPHLFYVMELCERSLFDVLHACRRPISTTERVAMAVRLCPSCRFSGVMPHRLRPQPRSGSGARPLQEHERGRACSIIRKATTEARKREGYLLF